ncbi:hypothetical protein MFRU_028g00380 [Monilinia fructicola]|uniref:Uncharacterized protein n=1 Tax=Monilinia fructicola TaxID=38448 RepID=A0A5M9JNC1_MONFR|nr:hypothetical protein EYC84_000364 [Monilinia fructicola]KAG4027616.1 hypothetical protein MFRU_028g00380 [Monilinia fructicola]
MASQAQQQKPSNGQAISPVPRTLPLDIDNPKFSDFVDLALLRVVDAASNLNNRPPRLFPTTETVFAKNFTCEEWLTYGDLETEIGRMNYMLENLHERGMPSSCIPHVVRLLSCSSVLTAWKGTLPQLKNSIAEEIRWVKSQIQKERRTNVFGHQKSDFIATPVDYRTNNIANNYGIKLWESSLTEIVHQVSRGNYKYTKNFLQIFAFLKDPLGGLGSVLDKSVSLFIYMMSSIAKLARNAPSISLTPKKWQASAAQAAQEALFLASPLLENVNYIHFASHQQLPYTYVPLDGLPRSEFSIPEHVLHIVEEILIEKHSQSEGTFCVAPIAVSSYPILPVQRGKNMTVIIDGNHRATAVMVLRLIAEHPTVLSPRKPDNQEALEKFCTSHTLGIKWKVDLAEVLEAIRNSVYHSKLLHENSDLVKKFRDAKSIPALVVREDNFHTVCQQRPALESRPRLLLPFHQAIYNDEKLNLAFPQAGQVHGRALGFKPMPLVRGKSE